MKTKICVLTGAGISAESGIKTFRDEGGLWEGHRVEDVATPEAWDANQDVVLNFYNERRRQLKNVLPNAGHEQLVRLESFADTVIITQNVDNLHERAGSSQVIHLHGELNKVRSTRNSSLIYDWPGDLNKNDLCELGAQLRPHIVWFGEAVPMLEKAILEIVEADFILIIGTSMQVYPAASLTSYAPDEAKILYVDPRPQINYELKRQIERVKIFEGPGSVKVKEAVDYIQTASK